MKLLLSFSLLAAVMALTSPAQALIEARVTYGNLSASPDLDALYDGSLSLPEKKASSGLGGDLMIFLPFSGFGFGVRQDDLGFKSNQGALEIDSKASRTSLLLAYRFINTVLHIGPIFSYGLSHSGKVKISDGSVNHEWSPDSASSYSAGLDVGLGLAAFVIGAEAGYQSMKWKDMKDERGTSNARPETKMDGSYAKVYFGLGI